jgi:tripartite-type tricarboxylate transporter receptor subunit TctC
MQRTFLSTSTSCTTSPIRRQLLHTGFALAASIALPVRSQTQGFIAAQKLRIVVPFGQGGRSEFFARTLATPLGEVLGETVVVENIPAYADAAEFAKVPPDGRTLRLSALRLPRRGVFTSVEENRLLASLVPITLVARDPCVLVMQSAQAQNLNITTTQQLVHYARRNPGKLTIAANAGETPMDLANELFKTMSQTYITPLDHGWQNNMAAVMNNRIDLMFQALHLVRRDIRNGLLRAIAITCGAQQPSPGLHTLGSAQGVPLLQADPMFAGYEINHFYPLIAPPGTPADIALRLQEACAEVLTLPAVRDTLLNVNGIPGGETLAQFLKLEDEEDARWRRARARW